MGASPAVLLLRWVIGTPAMGDVVSAAAAAVATTRWHVEQENAKGRRKMRTRRRAGRGRRLWDGTRACGPAGVRRPGEVSKRGRSSCARGEIRRDTGVK